MTSHVNRVNVLTRQRLLSEDLNNTGRMFGRALCLSDLAAQLGDEYLEGGVGTGGVLGGFLVEAIPGSNRILVSPGVAFTAQVPASATYDPPVFWIELGVATEIDLSALIDAGNPRLVTIEIEATEATLATAVVDIFDPATGTFGVNPAAARVLGSDPTITTSAGAAGPAPVVAAGTVGRLPLAIVKLVAAQASFTDAYAPVLMCRPLMQAKGKRIVPEDYVRGGGCSVGEESGGAIVNLTNVYLSKLSCSMLGLEAEVAGLIEFATRGRTISTSSPAALLGTAQAVYGYAAHPPWAGDYGQIAPREAWQRNPNAIALSNVQSIVVGQGSTFTSLSAATTTSPWRSFKNAIVFWDNVAPFGTERGAGNAPLQVLDARGPHPDTAIGGAGSVTLLASQDVAWGATQEITESVYVGAVSALDVAADFMGQSHTGGGRIRAIDDADLAGAKRRPYMQDLAGTLGAATNFYPGHYPDMLVGDPDVLPETAGFLELWCRLDIAVGTNATLHVYSPFGFGGLENPGGFSNFGGRSITAQAAVGADIRLIEPNVPVETGATGAGIYALAIGVGTVFQTTLNVYVDAVLASR